MAVAVSGGRDSLALLHVTARQARALGLGAAALHVHHGLQRDADDWALHVQRVCEQWAGEGLPVRWLTRRLHGVPGKGESIEAWARRGRYAALEAMAREAGAQLLLLAHHREDQSETVMLQALRGAGAAGLAAMPRVRERDGLVWARPWLDQPRSRIEAYVAAHGLRHIEDPSNSDTRHPRNRLRGVLMPALRTDFPDADAALAAVARRSAQTRALIETLVARELPTIRVGDALAVQAWLQQPAAWRAELLRAWLGRVLPSGAPESLVQRLIGELAATSSGRWPAPGGELRLHRGRLRYVVLAQPTPIPSGPVSLPLPLLLVPGRHELPGWNACLAAEAVESGGLDPGLLKGAQWRQRSGGERFQRAPGTPARSLKKQFQAAGVPAWQRDAPLLWSERGQLLFVPALGIDARAWADPGTPQLRLRWLPSGDEGRAEDGTAAA